MALGFTSADITALKEALATGATRVTIGDRTIEYRSLKELKEVIEMALSELNAGSTDLASNPSVVRATFSRGGK